MNLSRFIAIRISHGETGKNTVSRPAIVISMVGVAIGVAVMILSVAVVLGFKHNISDKVTGFGSHIQVGNFLTMQTTASYPIIMSDSVTHMLQETNGVQHVQRFSTIRGILKTDKDFLGVLFKGVGRDFDSLFLHQNLVAGTIPVFSDSVNTTKLLISEHIANKLQLKPGERLMAYFIDEGGVRPRRFTIAGIYNTHLSQYDESVCFTDIYTVNRLQGWTLSQAEGAELRIEDFTQLDNVYNKIVDKVNRTTDVNGETYSSRTIKDLNPQIFLWLELLDLNVWIILGLMVAVASVTMISGLLIIILERTSMIGTLKALGASNRSIRHTFLWVSVFLITRGLVYGNVLALFLILVQKVTGLVKLDPDIYYVSTLPVEINIPLWLLINVATLLVCVAVLIVPSHFISHIKPAKSMRYE